jgi:DNA-nicking Smr family endonuclease
MEAAFQTVHENSQNHKQSEDTTVVVDLHHLRVHEAETVLDHEMERWQSQLKRDQGERCGNGRRPLMHIITGMGNRSAGRSPRLQPAVCQYLIRHGWAFETGPGYFLVRPK